MSASASGCACGCITASSRSIVGPRDHTRPLPRSSGLATGESRDRAPLGAHPATPRTPRRTWTFDVCVIGHLRAEKDPFRAALAMRHLPADSSIRLLHVGRAMTPAMARRARAEMRRNARYRWLGERPGGATRALLARSRAMVLSSRLEGGANVVSEAVVSGVPVVASRIPGSVGLLGPDYPGYFPVGATRALAAVLRRMECAPAFYARLARACRRRAHLFAPAAEQRAWASLLCEVAPGPRLARLSGSSPGGWSAGDPRGR